MLILLQPVELHILIIQNNEEHKISRSVCNDTVFTLRLSCELTQAGVATLVIVSYLLDDKSPLPFINLFGVPVVE